MIAILLWVMIGWCINVHLGDANMNIDKAELDRFYGKPTDPIEMSNMWYWPFANNGLNIGYIILWPLVLFAVIIVMGVIIWKRIKND